MSEAMNMLLIELEHDLELYEDEIPHQLYANCNKLMKAYTALESKASSEASGEFTKQDVLWAYARGIKDGAANMQTFCVETLLDLNFNS